MSGTVQEIASAITEILAGAGPQLGSHLAAKIRVRFPDFVPTAFEATNLRDFIVKHAPTVAVVGRSGMDVVYGLVSDQPTAERALDPVTDFWRVWASPNSPHALVVDRESGAVHAAPRRTTVRSSELLLEPPSVSDHRQVARDFLAVQPELESRLRSIVDSGDPLWWQSWVKELRGTDCLPAWNGFRADRLDALLKDRLAQAGLAGAAVDAVSKQVHDSHVSAPRAPRPLNAGVPWPPREPAIEDAIRRVAALAVQRMSTAELRELRLPLGAVLDALATLKSQ